MPDVHLEQRVDKGRQLWIVSLGRRTLSFHEELAARTFAAQLHQRLRWLHQQAQPGSNS